MLKRTLLCCLLTGGLLISAQAQRLEIGFSPIGNIRIFDINFASIDRFSQLYADFGNLSVFLIDFEFGNNYSSIFDFGAFAHYHFKNHAFLRAEITNSSYFGGVATFYYVDDLIFPEGDEFTFENALILNGFSSALSLCTKLSEGKKITPLFIVGLNYQRTYTLTDGPDQQNNPFLIALRPFQTIAPNILYGRLGLGVSFFEFPLMVYLERNLTPTDIDPNGTFQSISSYKVSWSIPLVKFNLQSNKYKKQLKQLNRQF